MSTHQTKKKDTRREGAQKEDSHAFVKRIMKEEREGKRPAPEYNSTSAKAILDKSEPLPTTQTFGRFQPRWNHRYRG